MSDRNANTTPDALFFDRETGEIISEMRTVQIEPTLSAPREADTEEAEATRGNVLGGTLRVNRRRSGASRSIAGGTIDRQRRQEQEQEEAEENVASFDAFDSVASGITWLGGPNMRMGGGTIQASSINVDSLRTSILNMEENGELDMVGELPSENVRSVTLPQPLRYVEVNLPSENIRYEELEPIEVPVDGQLRTAEGLGTSRILFQNGSEIRGLSDEDVFFDDGMTASMSMEATSTLPSSYMGDASDIVARINQAPVTEPLMATHIDLNGYVTFSNLSTNTLPENMARVSAVAEEAGTFIAVPEDGNQEWRTSNDSWVSQGIYENEVGNAVFHKGCWFFGDAMDILEGKTIHNATLKIKKSFSVGGDDVKAYIVGHPHNDLPTTEPYVTKVSVLKRIRAHELDHVFVDLAPFKDLISRGLIKGFGVYTEESGITEFASFDREAELEITWY